MLAPALIPAALISAAITTQALIAPKKAVTLVSDPNKVYDVPDRDTWL